MLAELKHCDQIQRLSIQQLEVLAEDCRQRILEVVSRNGGHLASSLGAVELTVALAKVFNFQTDKVIWDVGHQTYAYKILTGRNAVFDQLGQKGGISKFLSRFESPCDHFGAGHASTSISAALGMSCARTLRKANYRTIAVIGDGAMTGGLSFEALNHAGHLDEDIIVILNDNEMSIDQNVGALSKTVLSISSSKSFNILRAEIIRQIRENKLPFAIRNTMDKVNDSMMAFFTKGVWFEKFDFRYFGQVDGHNIKKMVSFLKLIKGLKGPILLHVLTHKGKGYPPAEANPSLYHGVGPFDLATGKPHKSIDHGKSYTAVWSQAFAEIMEADDEVVGVSAAMLANTGLVNIRQRYPGRIFDVGIAEGHAVTFSGGLSTQGFKPFVVVYSTFLQRAFDHIVHDIARQNLPVRFILDRAGLVGADGATHHGQLDLTYLRMIPNMVVMAPSNGAELQAMINLAHQYQAGPIALRFPRGHTGVLLDQKQIDIPAIPLGKGELMRSGSDVLLLAIGSMVDTACRVGRRLEKLGYSVGVINARFVKPLDRDLILQEVGKVGLLATLEENVRNGGFGSGVLELLAEAGVLVPTLQLAIPDRFIKFATREEQLQEAGLDEDSVLAALQQALQRRTAFPARAAAPSPALDVGT